MLGACASEESSSTTPGATVIPATSVETAATTVPVATSTTASAATLDEFCELAIQALGRELELDRLMLTTPASEWEQAADAAVAANTAAAAAAPVAMQTAWQQLASATTSYQQFLQGFDYDIVRMLDSMTAYEQQADWQPARRDIEAAMLTGCAGYTGYEPFNAELSDDVPSEYDEFVSTNRMDVHSIAADALLTDDQTLCLGRYVHGTLPVAYATRGLFWTEDIAKDAWQRSFYVSRASQLIADMLLACGDAQRYSAGLTVQWLSVDGPLRQSPISRDLVSCFGNSFGDAGGDVRSLLLAVSPAVSALPDAVSVQVLSDAVATASSACGYPIDGAAIALRIEQLHSDWASAAQS